MFKPKDKKARLNYGEMLMPPKGFTLKSAVTTTFSLDFDALTSAAFALGLGTDTDAELIDNPAMCLHSLQKVTDKLVVFCEAGQIKKPQKDNPLYGLLAKTVSMVTVQKKDSAGHFPSFHPKVWIIEYASKTEKRYRLLVMSRNLSFDRSYDVCVRFDGIAGGTKAELAKSKPIIDFLEFLGSTIKADTPNQESKRKIVKTLMSALQGVSFSIGDDNREFVDFEFFPLGIPKAKKLLGTGFDKADFHQLVIMSPFLSADIIDKFSEPNLYIGEANRKRALITRASELYKLKACPIDKWDIYVLKEEVVRGEEYASEDGDIEKQDIHAKIYTRNRGREGGFYLGSANASYSAFNRNVEFMTGLYTYSSRGKGYLPWQFLDELIGGEKEEECPFECVDKSVILEAAQEKDEDEKRKLEFIIKTFCRAGLSAAVLAKNGGYDIELTVNQKEIIPNFDYLTIAPLGEEGKAKKIAEKMIFNDVDLLHLSQFYIVTARIGEETLPRIIMIPTASIPKEVEAAIVNKVIANTDAFNDYLNAILSDDILTGYLQGALEHSSLLGNTASKQVGAALYEKLLYAAAHHPERFKEIAYIEERLNVDGFAIAQFEEFKRVFKVFETAVDAGRDAGGKS